MIIDDIKKNFIQDNFTDCHPMSSNIYYMPNGSSLFVDNYCCNYHYVINNNEKKIKESCDLSVEYRDYVIHSLRELDDTDMLRDYCTNALLHAKHEMEIVSNKIADNPMDNQAISDHMSMLEEQIDYMTRLSSAGMDKEIGD